MFRLQLGLVGSNVGIAELSRSFDMLVPAERVTSKAVRGWRRPVWKCQLASGPTTGDQRQIQKNRPCGAGSASCQKQRATEIVSRCVQALTDQHLHPGLVLAALRPGLSGRRLYFRLLTQRQPDCKRPSRRYYSDVGGSEMFLWRSSRRHSASLASDATVGDT